MNYIDKNHVFVIVYTRLRDGFLTKNPPSDISVFRSYRNALRFLVGCRSSALRDKMKVESSIPWQRKPKGHQIMYELILIEGSMTLILSIIRVPTYDFTFPDDCLDINSLMTL